MYEGSDVSLKLCKFKAYVTVMCFLSSFFLFLFFSIVLYLGDILEGRHSLPTNILDNHVHIAELPLKFESSDISSKECLCFCSIS